MSRIKQYGTNALNEQRKNTALGLLVSQFKSPLVLILIFASIVSAFAGGWTDAIIVLAVVICSTVLGFVQEYRASNAVEKLRSQVTIKSSILRSSIQMASNPAQIVPIHIPFQRSLAHALRIALLFGFRGVFMTTVHTPITLWTGFRCFSSVLASGLLASWTFHLSSSAYTFSHSPQSNPTSTSPKCADWIQPCYFCDRPCQLDASRALLPGIAEEAVDILN